jgi:hypothetical protein
MRTLTGGLTLRLTTRGEQPMPKTNADRIEELQDQVYALQQLLLTHIVACDGIDRAITLNTVKGAREQVAALIEKGRARAAISLDGFIKALEEIFD